MSTHQIKFDVPIFFFSQLSNEITSALCKHQDTINLFSKTDCRGAGADLSARQSFIKPLIHASNEHE